MPAERSSRAASRANLFATAPESDPAAEAAAGRELFPPRSSGGIAFAPNVTPGTFNDPPPPLSDDDDFPPTESLLFPAESLDAASPTSPSSSGRPRSAHGRKKPENYIPRPPNAFILFRSAFIRSRNVSTNVETNHSTLSKIIGLTWQNLPEQEKRVWHRKAKVAEAEHKLKFPQYAFKPVHNKAKKALKASSAAARKVRETGPKDHVRCAKIAQFLVQGLKGEALDAAIEEFDKGHVPEVVTRFEAPITEESFEQSQSPSASPTQERRAGSAPIPDSAASFPTGKKLAAILGRQPRSVSSAPSRRSTPYRNISSPVGASAVRVHSSLSSAPFDMEHVQGHEQQQLYSLEQFTFDQAKRDPSSDFSSFGSAFNASDSVHSLSPPFGPHTPSSLSLSHPSFSPASSSFPSPHSQPISLPELHIDTSFITRDREDSPHGSPNNPWSPCHSQRSLPSSSSMSGHSMPPTPSSYSGGNLQLPDDPYGQQNNGSAAAAYQQHCMDNFNPDYVIQPPKLDTSSLHLPPIPGLMLPSSAHFANMAYQAQHGMGSADVAGQYTDPAHYAYSSSYGDLVDHSQEIEYPLHQQQHQQGGGALGIQCPSPITPTPAHMHGGYNNHNSYMMMPAQGSYAL